MRSASVILALLIACLACSAVACDENQTYTADYFDRAPSDVEPTMTATPEPVSQEDALQVNGVIHALQTDDPEAIAATIGYRTIGCAETTSPGGPPECEGAEDPGDQVQAFYFSDCEGAYLREADIDRAIFALTALDVEGAYRLLNRTEDGYQYAIVLVDNAPEREGMAWEAVVDQGEIIGLLYSCALSPEDLIEVRNYPIAVPTPAPTAPATPAP